jgi:Holliday junction resolvase RusA-like endonuclease
LTIDFIAIGRPEPQGWLKAVSLPGRKFTVLVDGNAKLKRWRKTVRQAAEIAMRNSGLFQPLAKGIPVRMQIQFCFKRPQSVDREHVTVKPDLDKLVRSVFDSLTGVVWADDSQVVRATAVKSYGEFERVEIRVEGMG